ncbi:MAG TPA: two-component sensor histidine kinase [Sporomusaceae bacterium]|nr:two-component sensor histidine kinase [Sporomusaceae bacterium]
MNITRMKWLAAVIPAICIGLFEFARHEYLHVISMSWGNVLVAVLTGLLFILFSHGIFTLMENLYSKLQQEKQETAILQERTRIARELHDSIAQSLFFMNVKVLEIEAAWKNSKDPCPAITDLREAIKLTDTELRQHIYTLQTVTPPDDNIELVSAIQTQLDQHETQTGAITALAATFDSAISFSSFQQKKLLHIFQELLFNIRKHAEATRVSVNLQEKNERFSMTITDDGKGFAPADLQQKKASFGYKILEQDILSIEADLKIAGAPGSGTTVIVTLKTGEREILS